MIFIPSIISQYLPTTLSICFPIFQQCRDTTAWFTVARSGTTSTRNSILLNGFHDRFEPVGSHQRPTMLVAASQFDDRRRADGIAFFDRSTTASHEPRSHEPAEHMDRPECRNSKLGDSRRSVLSLSLVSSLLFALVPTLCPRPPLHNHANQPQPFPTNLI